MTRDSRLIITLLTGNIPQTVRYIRIYCPGVDIEVFRLPALGQLVFRADLSEHQFYLPHT